MKKYLIVPAIIFIAWACGNQDNTPVATGDSSSSSNPSASSGSSVSHDSAEDTKGIGKFTHVDIPSTIDQSMVSGGQKIYDLKCGSCHRLDETKLVGPGWKGVTSRRKPEWIMNFVTNTDVNLDKNAQAMSLLEECMVRMPNQNLADADARNVLEFMRNNDAKK